MRPKTNESLNKSAPFFEKYFFMVYFPRLSRLVLLWNNLISRDDHRTKRSSRLPCPRTLYTQLSRPRRGLQSNLRIADQRSLVISVWSLVLELLPESLPKSLLSSLLSLKVQPFSLLESRESRSELIQYSIILYDRGDMGHASFHITPMWKYPSQSFLAKLVIVTC